MDLHAKTAAEIFGVPVDQLTPEQRRAGRSINFGIAHGTDGMVALDFETDFRGSYRSGMSRLRGVSLIHRFFEEYEGVTLDDIRPKGESLLRLRSFRMSLVTEIALRGFDV